MIKKRNSKIPNSIEDYFIPIEHPISHMYNRLINENMQNITFFLGSLLQIAKKMITVNWKKTEPSSLWFPR